MSASRDSAEGEESAAAPATGGASNGRRLQQLYEEGQRREERLALVREEEARQLTFQPRLRHGAGKGRGGGSGGTVFARLYDNAGRQQQRRQMEEELAQEAESRLSKAPARKTKAEVDAAVARMHRQEAARQKRIEEMARSRDAALKFQPHIVTGSHVPGRSRRTGDASVHEDLYASAQRHVQRQERLEKEARERFQKEHPFTPQKVATSTPGGSTATNSTPVFQRLYEEDLSHREKAEAQFAEKIRKEEARVYTFQPRLETSRPAARGTSAGADAAGANGTATTAGSTATSNGQPRRRGSANSSRSQSSSAAEAAIKVTAAGVSVVPATTPQPTSGGDTAVFSRLYDNAVQMQEHRRYMHDTAMPPECTFAPSLRSHSPEAGALHNRQQQAGDAVFTNLYDDGFRRSQQRSSLPSDYKEALRVRDEEAELQECTFQPRLQIGAARSSSRGSGSSGARSASRDGNGTRRHTDPGAASRAARGGGSGNGDAANGHSEIAPRLRGNSTDLNAAEAAAPTAAATSADGDDEVPETDEEGPDAAASTETPGSARSVSSSPSADAPVSAAADGVGADASADSTANDLETTLPGTPIVADAASDVAVIGSVVGQDSAAELSSIAAIHLDVEDGGSAVESNDATEGHTT